MRLFIISLSLVFCIGAAKGQDNMDVKQAKQKLQGFWVFANDSTYTMVFSGDTMLEYHIGDKEIDLVTYSLSAKGCDTASDNSQSPDPQDPAPPKASVYIILDGDDEDGGLCAALVFPDEEHALLLISEDKGVERGLALERKF